MNRTMGFAIAASVLTLSVATEAFAQETEGERFGYLRQHVRAPPRAVLEPVRAQRPAAAAAASMACR